jgi:hypothetical protein
VRNVAVALLAVLGAALLSAAYLGPALKAAGYYGQLTAVRLPLVLVLFVTYLVLSVSMLLALRRALSIQSTPQRWLLFITISAAATLAYVFVPALPFLLLVLTCKYQPLCPEYANPIGWALLGLVGPAELPFAPAWRVFGAGVASYVLHSRNARSSNDVLHVGPSDRV